MYKIINQGVRLRSMELMSFFYGTVEKCTHHSPTPAKPIFASHDRTQLIINPRESWDEAPYHLIQAMAMPQGKVYPPQTHLQK